MSALLALPDDELHVWTTRLAEGPPPDLDSLAPEERARADRLASRTRRERWLIARARLRSILARYLDVGPAEVQLVSACEGKPELAGAPLRFNLSHSGDLALYVLAREREVGVDVERVRKDRDHLALARRALPGAVVETLERATPHERPLLFTAAWARHEARAKCLGTGLAAAEPASTASVSVLDLDTEAGYAAALAVEGELAPGSVVEIEPGRVGVPGCRLRVLAGAMVPAPRTNAPRIRTTGGGGSAPPSRPRPGA